MGLVRHSDEATPEGGPADTHRSLVPRQRLQVLRCCVLLRQKGTATTN